MWGNMLFVFVYNRIKMATLLAEHRKDFIVKIGDCDFAGAQLLPRPVTCDGFNVSFYNDNNSPLNQTFFGILVYHLLQMILPIFLAQHLLILIQGYMFINL